MSRIDAHQHFWALKRGDYGWLTPDLGPIHRDFSPHDLEPLLQTHDISGTILVQAAPTEAETRFMLNLADSNPFIRGVVGWIDFSAPDAPERIVDLARHPALVGLRPMIQEIPDPDWMLGETLTPAFQTMLAQDLTFEALTLPRHLPKLLTLLQRHPDLRVVIDHGSKPEIRDQLIDGWALDMSVLAHETGAYCKLSGLMTEAAADWSVEDLKPYVGHMLDCFGPDRLIWGSDWPVCTLAGSYDRWIETTETLLAELSGPERDAVLGGNATRAYLLRE